jgi:hypothetical protein
MSVAICRRGHWTAFCSLPQNHEHGDGSRNIFSNEKMSASSRRTLGERGYVVAQIHNPHSARYADSAGSRRAYSALTSARAGAVDQRLTSIGF